MKNTLFALDVASSGGEPEGGNSATKFKQTHGSIIKEYADNYGIDKNVLGAFIWVESSGSGFSDGKVKIRFENHKFLVDDASQYKDYYQMASSYNGANNATEYSAKIEAHYSIYQKA